MTLRISPTLALPEKDAEMIIDALDNALTSV